MAQHFPITKQDYKRVFEISELVRNYIKKSSWIKTKFDNQLFQTDCIYRYEITFLSRDYAENNGYAILLTVPDSIVQKKYDLDRWGYEINSFEVHFNESFTQVTNIFVVL